MPNKLGGGGQNIAHLYKCCGHGRFYAICCLTDFSSDLYNFSSLK